MTCFDSRPLSCLQPRKEPYSTGPTLAYEGPYYAFLSSEAQVCLHLPVLGTSKGGRAVLGQNCKPEDLQPFASSVPKGQSVPRGGGKNGEKLRPDL